MSEDQQQPDFALDLDSIADLTCACTRCMHNTWPMNGAARCNLKRVYLDGNGQCRMQQVPDDGL